MGLTTVDEAREALLALLNSLGIVGPNIIHVEQGMYPDGKQSADDTWDGPGWCVCGRRWPCEALATIAAVDALIAAVRAEYAEYPGRGRGDGMNVWHDGHIMGGYQNPKCPACQREERARLRQQALEQGFSDEFAAGYISAIDDLEAFVERNPYYDDTNAPPWLREKEEW